MTYYIAPEQDGSDYQPLTMQELIELLDATIGAKDHQDTATVGDIHCRLLQAVPGSTSPNAADGPVVEKQYELDRVYTRWIKDPNTLFLKEFESLTESSEIVVKLWALMKE